MDPEFKKRLQETYHVEAAEHLDRIATGILSMEEGGDEGKQAEILQEVYREFHSLKGAARAVNEPVVDTVCHACEDILSRVTEGETSSADVLNRLREAISLLRRCQGHTEGQPAVGDEEVARVMALLEERTETGPKFEPPKSAASKVASVRPMPPAPKVEEEPKQIALSTVLQTGTVRTPVDRLDAILYRAEEMLGLREESGRNLERTIALRTRLVEWRRESARAHLDARLLRRLAKEATGGALSPDVRRAMNQISDFLDWNRRFLEGLGGDIRELVKRSATRYGAFEVNVDRLLDETKELLMVPFSQEMEGLAIFVDECARDRPTPKRARLRLEGGDVEVDRRILEAMKDPFIHLLRNAIDHGLEEPAEREQKGKPADGTIRFSVTPLGDGRVEMLVVDDGRGIQTDDLRSKAVAAGLIDEREIPHISKRRLLEFVFTPNFSTRKEVSETSGRGLGLAIVKESAERLGGHVTVSSEEGQGTAFRIVLPLSIARFRAVEISSGGRPFLVPSAKIVRAGRVPRTSVRPVKGRDTIKVDSEILPLVWLSDILDLTEVQAGETEQVIFVTMNERGSEFALAVEELGEEREAVLKSLGPQLRHVRHIAGASVGIHGEIIPVIHAADVARTVGGGAAAAAGAIPESIPVHRPARVLVVEDSITARSLLKNILEGDGYPVATAQDGVEALSLMRRENFDLVVTDLEMPRMGGFELTKEVRRDEKLRDMPVVVLTALASREDKERGMEAGADAYVVKSSFDQSDLLNIVKDLVRND